MDAELIRPRAWIRSVGIEAGKLLPINIEELQVKGSATVTSIDDCPEIADGEGSVVTARFITRQVHVVASVDIQGPDGSIETITGTPIHPIWSVDRQEWVPLGELTEGETLQGFDGLAIVLGLSITTVAKPVYNIEVHGEHVYQIGELGLLVHNACYEELVDGARQLYPKKAFRIERHHITPKYMGGASDGPLSSIDAAYHQLITNEFRALHPYGSMIPTPERLAEIMRQVYTSFPLPG